MPLFRLSDAEFNNGPTVVGGESGEFRAANVSPGLYQLAWRADLPAGSYIETIRNGSRDVLRDGLIVTPGAESSMVVVIRNGSASIQGTARHVNGDLAQGAQIILVPPRLERGPFVSFPAVASDPFGRYLFENVRPGAYRILAIDMAGRQAAGGAPFWETEAFLGQYELRAELITVDPGARLTIDPEAIPLP
jgi:hypothetical protein